MSEEKKSTSDFELKLNASDLIPDWAKEAQSLFPSTVKKNSQDDNKAKVAYPKVKNKFQNKFSRSDDRPSRPSNNNQQPYQKKFGNDSFNKNKFSRNKFSDNKYQKRPQNRYTHNELIPPPLEGLKISFYPHESTYNIIADHIRATQYCYPILNLAKTILADKSRYNIHFNHHPPEKNDALKKSKNLDNTKQQDQFKNSSKHIIKCIIDNSLWLNQEEALNHILNPDIIKKLYDVEEITQDKPKGNFKSIAVCPVTNKPICPPNHHEYQQEISNSYNQCSARMSFNAYKSRVKIVSDEEVINQWLESRSKTFHYNPKKITDYKILLKQVNFENKALTPNPTESSKPDTDANIDTDSQADKSQEANIEKSTPTDNTVTDNAVTDNSPQDKNQITTDNSDVTEKEQETPLNTDPQKIQENKSEEIQPSESDEPNQSDETSSTNEAETEKEKVLKSRIELIYHLKKNHLDSILITVRRSSVPSIDLKKLVNLDLFLYAIQQYKIINKHPIGLARHLCRSLSNKGLKVFKQGKNEIFIGTTIPKPLPNLDTINETAKKIALHLQQNGGCKVSKLLQDFGIELPNEKNSKENTSLPDDAKNLLHTVKWMLSSGYIIELSDTSLYIAKVEKPILQNVSKPNKKVDHKNISKAKAKVDITPKDKPAENKKAENIDKPVEDSKPEDKSKIDNIKADKTPEITKKETPSVKTEITEQPSENTNTENNSEVNDIKADKSKEDSETKTDTTKTTEQPADTVNDITTVVN